MWNNNRIIGVFSCLWLIFHLALGYPNPNDNSIHLQSEATGNEKGFFDQNSSKATLRLISVVFRHGDRAPATSYPTDPHLNSTMEPYGWGQLTNAGRINQYNQGMFLRERYGEFLGDLYHPDIFYLQSTGIDRTKMSAMLEAAALWKPSEKQTFDKNLPWQPTAINYEPLENDSLLLIFNTCPAYVQSLEKLSNSELLSQIKADNQQLYDELSKLTGLKISNPLDVLELYTTLMSESAMNLEIPEWTKDYYPDKMTPLSILAFELIVYTEQMKRLKNGPLLNKLLTDMEKKRDGELKPKRRKMFMYSTHDSTVAELLQGLKVWNKRLPPFNAMVMLELHEKNSNWNVQILLRNSTQSPPHPLTVPGCTFECPLEKFRELLTPHLPEDWEKECVVDDKDYVPLPPRLP